MRTALVLVLLLLAVVAQYAQEQGGLRFGFEGQIFASDVVGDKNFDLKSKIGIMPNPTVYLRIGSKTSLSTGFGIQFLNYEAKDYTPSFGCDFDGMGGINRHNSWSESKRRVQFLVVPLEFHHYFSNNPNRYYIAPGIQVLFDVLKENTAQLYECGEPTALVEDTPFETTQLLGSIKLGREFSTLFNDLSILKLFDYRLGFNVGYSLTHIFETDDRNRRWLQLGMHYTIIF